MSRDGPSIKSSKNVKRDQCPWFLALLADPTISHIGVEHKDRASRFEIGSIHTLLAIQGRELIVVNTAEAAEEDLMSDLVSIIPSFVARFYGRRRAKRKTEQVQAALQQNGSKSSEPHARQGQEATPT